MRTKLLPFLLFICVILGLAPRLPAQGISVFKSNTAGTVVTTGTFGFTSAATPPLVQTINFTNGTGRVMQNLLINVTQKNPYSFMLLKYQCLIVANSGYYDVCWKSLTVKTLNFFLGDGQRIQPGGNFQIQLRNLAFKWDPSSQFTVTIDSPDPRAEPAPLLQDFDANAIADLAWQNQTTGEAIVWSMNGAEVGSSIALPPIPTDWSRIGVLDLNGDHRADVLIQNATSGDLAALMNVGGAFESHSIAVARKGNLLATGDFNGDGKADIIFIDNELGAVVWFMDGPTINSEVGAAIASQPSWDVMGTGDFNADGKTDLIWRDDQTGQVFLTLMDGANSTVVSLPAETPVAVMIGAIGDFNGDGKAELLWRKAQGENFLWKIDGTVVTKEAVQSTPDLDWQIAGVGDLNGDGKADLAWHNRTTGEDLIWFMDGAKVTQAVATTAMPGVNWKVF